MKIILSIVLLFVGLATFSLEIDNSAIVIQDEAFNRAMVAFGLAKGLNAVISLLQGTELSLTPVGVGVNVSIGEVLDPFNDMVERFSWVMLFASVSLGIQKFLLLLSGKLFVQIALGISACIVFVLLWFKKIHNAKVLHYTLKFFALFLVLRFSTILFVYSSEMLYISTLQQEYNDSASIVEKTKAELEELKDSSGTMIEAKTTQSKWERFSTNIDNFSTTLNISKQLSKLNESIERASKNIITLITIFVIESILLPILFLWLLLLSMKFLFRIEFNEEKLKLLYN